MFLLFLALFLFVPVAQGADTFRLSITAFDPQAEQDWALITVLSGSGTVTDLIFTDLDGIDTPIAGATATVSEGDQFLVHWGTGSDEVDGTGDMNQNGFRDFFVEDADLSSTDDQLVVLRSGEILDAAVWTNGDGTLSDSEHADMQSLVASGLWEGSVGQESAIHLGASGTWLERPAEVSEIPRADVWRIASGSPPGSESGPTETPLSDSGSGGESGSTPDSTGIVSVDDDEVESPQSLVYSTRVLLSEVMPNPIGNDEEGEFIEIVNQDSEKIDLGHWSLQDASGKTYKIPEGIQIQPGAYSAFSRLVTGISLNNDTDTVQLRDPNGHIVSALTYVGPFPEGTGIAREEGKWKQTEIPTQNQKNIIAAQQAKSTNVSSAAAGEQATYSVQKLTNDETENITHGVEQEIAPSDVPEVTILTARHAEPGSLVRVVGSVIAPLGLLGANTLYLHDGSAGIAIGVPENTHPDADIGTVLEVTGVVKSFHGDRRIVTGSAEDMFVTEQNNDRIPTMLSPNEVGISEVGNLVTVQGIIERSVGQSWELAGSDARITIKETTGIKKPTAKKGDTVTATGIVTTYDRTLSILPRFLSDVTIIQQSKSASTSTKKKSTSKSVSTVSEQSQLSLLESLQTHDEDTFLATDADNAKSIFDFLSLQMWIVIIVSLVLAGAAAYWWENKRTITTDEAEQASELRSLAE